ncbi:MAG: hypothetical protein U0Q11_24440 [Vicinamibacterales bacterium]
MRKQGSDLPDSQAQTGEQSSSPISSVLEVLPGGFGFLRAPDYNYLRD